MIITPFAKQMFVATTAHLASISMGGSVAYPCILLQQLTSNESSIHTDMDTLSWIASMHGITGIGASGMSAIMQMTGRKYAFIASCVLLLIGWILSFAAMNAMSVVISSALHGLASNCITIVNLVTTSEMLAPKYRHVSMTLLIISQGLGQTVVTVSGPFVDWKLVALIMCAPAVLAIAMALFWPESPLWLACKGKFDQCERNFLWLRGTDDNSIKELHELISAQKASRKNVSRNTKCQEFWRKIKMKDFYIPALFMIVILFNFFISGGISMYIYSKDILELGTNPDLAITGYLICAISMFIVGCILPLVLMAYFKIKTVFCTVFGCIFCLLCCALIYHFKSIGMLANDSTLFIYFYIGFIAFSISGLSPVTFSLGVELMPVKHRGIGGILFNTCTCIFYVITVKPFPYMISSINLSWTLVSYAAISSICSVLILIYVPETKNRTLQEIENYYNFGSFVRPRDLDDNELNLPIVKSNVKD